MSGSFKLVNNRQFIDRLDDERSNGYGFVPLIGAGASASCGIPIIRDVHFYLANCIALALQDGPRPFQPRWLPGIHPWPKLDQRRKLIHSTGEYSCNAVDHIYMLFAGQGTSSQHVIYREAAGAAADWRRALEFLSRLTFVDNSLVTRGSANRDIIDSYFRSVVEGKEPGQFHYHLASLADFLRMRIILTTNFDSLIERAFEREGKLLRRVPVHYNSELPPHSSLGDGCSIVKLHGELYGLRADLSLDDEPSETDMLRFASYLNGQEFSPNDRDSRAPTNCLLVIGSSAEDERLTKFLLNAKNIYEKHPVKVYWICYSRNAFRNLKQLADAGLQVVATRHRFLDLYFGQIFQTLMGTIPRRHAIYPNVASLPYPPDPVPLKQSIDGEFDFESFRKYTLTESHTSASSFWKEVSDKIRQAQSASCGRLITVSSLQNQVGVTSTAAGIFYELSKENLCVWIDLDDICNANDLFEQIIKSISSKHGLDGWLPVNFEKGDRVREDELSRLARSVDSRVVVFLNARERAGGSSLFKYSEDVVELNHPNGWLDVKPDETPFTGESKELEGEFGNVDSFIGLIEEMTGSKCQPITVVLLANESEKTIDNVLVEKLEIHSFPEPIRLPKSFRNTLPSRQIRRAMRWIQAGDSSKKFDTPRNRARFLFGLCLMRRPRHACVTQSAVCLSDPVPEPVVKRWVEKLQKERVLLTKPGGFIWMHRDTREGVRRKIAKKFKPDEPRVQDEIANWYQTLFISSNAAFAAIESIVHRCESAMADDDSNSIRQHLGVASRLAKEMVSSALSSAFSRGLCRRITQLRCLLIRALYKKCAKDKKSLAMLLELETRLIQLKRSLAREVGEHERAFWRHRQILELAINAKVQVNVSLHEHLKVKKKQRRKLRNKQLANVPNAFDWLKWQREIGTIAIGTRSYRYAQRNFNEVYRFYLKMLPDAEHDLEGLRGPQFLEAYWHALPRFEHHGNRIGALLGTIRRNLQLLILEGQIERMGRRFHTDDARREASRERSEQLFGLAQTAAETYKSLLRYSGSRTSPDLSYDIQSVLTRESSAVAALGRFRDSIRLLEEARLFLQQSKGSDGLPLAVIELHMSETLMQHAMYGSNYEHDRSVSKFLEFRRLLLEEAATEKAGLFAEANVQREKIISTATSEARVLHEDHMKSFALLRDAELALARAGELLRGSRKNSWWDSWFLELKMRNLEYTTFASIITRDCISLNDTVQTAEEFLDQSMRLIRYDVLRFVRVSEAYANVMFALYVRYLSEERSLLDPAAFDRGETIGRLVRLAGDMIERRSALRPSLDQRVLVYSQNAIKHLASIETHIRNC